MHTKILTAAVLASASAGLAIGVPDAAFAQAAAPTNSSTAPQGEALQTQIQALKTQIDNMKRQIDLMQEKTPPNAKPAPKVVESGTHKFSLESADGQYSIALTGRIHADLGGYFDFKPDSTVGPINGAPGTLSNGFNARRARIGATGKVAGDWTYNFIYDTGNSQDGTARGIQSAQLIYNGIKGMAFELGYSDTYFTLDESISSNDIMFIERSSAAIIATTLNAGDFRSNAGVRFYGDRYWVGAYLTGPTSSTDSHTLSVERFGAFQRATYQVLQTPDYTLHVGVDIDELIKAPNTGPGTARSVTLNDPPELRIDPTSFLTTGGLGSTTHPVTSGRVYGAEAAANYKNVYFQSEYYHIKVDRTGLSSAKFDSAYAEVAWTFTGESRKYIPGIGAYGTIVPAHPFSRKEGTWGAWEIAARGSYVDLTSDFAPGLSAAAQPNAVDGGRETVLTAGLNWYPNSLIRFMFNYVHTDFTKLNLNATGIAPGTPIGAKINGVALRTQVIW
jgi:phosphate-selective porin OprO/OprP